MPPRRYIISPPLTRGVHSIAYRLTMIDALVSTGLSRCIVACRFGWWVEGGIGEKADRCERR